jgi:ParB family chromosome partitioning protein
MIRKGAPSSQAQLSHEQTATAEVSPRRLVLPVDSIVPDPRNRKVLDDEAFRGLVDSVRILGILQPPHARDRNDGSYLLVDGERRWRAAREAGLKEIACDVWPIDTDARTIGLAGLALNVQRAAHGCIQIARRLRDIKNEHGLTVEELARQTGLPLDRVKSYFALFGISDYLMTFCEEHNVPLRVAVALVRYERATNEARVKALAARYQKQCLTCEEINSLRKRAEAKDKAPGTKDTDPEITVPRARRILVRFEVEYRRDQSTALSELGALVDRLGYRLAAREEA